MCIRPNARLLSVSQGKGVSPELAQVSAIMESIELYHAERVRPPDVVASYRQMRRRYPTLDPEELPPGIRWPAYAPGRPMAWARAADLSSGEPVFVPHIRINLDSTAVRPDVGLLAADSNGLASGNERWEAICHGLFEVIERDCDWRWRRLSPDERQQRLLDNDTIDAPLLRSLLARFAKADVTVRIWDITSDLDVPAYRCVIRDVEAWRPLGASIGTGCHLSTEVALARALTEAAQSRLTSIAGARDDMFPAQYERSRASWVPGAQTPPPHGTSDFRARRAPRAMATFEKDARWVVDQLNEAGYRHVAVVDHTPPDAGISVVHVIVPGLQATR